MNPEEILQSFNREESALDVAIDLDDGVGEMLETIEKFIETYKRHAQENIIDHKHTIEEFQCSGPTTSNSPSNDKNHGEL